jgi:hypothetical protein
MLANIYLVYVGIILLTSLLIFNRSGLYISGSKVVFLFPFFCQFDINNVASVRASERYRFISNVVVELKSGKKCAIWATYLDKTADEIVSALYGRIL